jgi:guanylate kinase
MKKIKVIALFGPAGAGKDFIQKAAAKRFGWHEVISHTTRPPREGEQNGIAYHFTNIQNFTHMERQGKFLERTMFNQWMYGTSIDSLSEDEINIGVFNIDGIKSLLADSRIDVTPIYLGVPDKVRLLRQLERETNPNCLEICRRFLADDYDFRMTIDFEYEYLYNNEEIDNVLDTLSLIKIN